MTKAEAFKIAREWPSWIAEWESETTKKIPNEDKKFIHAMYSQAIDITLRNAPMIEWFIHCLYKHGYKIVPKK